MVNTRFSNPIHSPDNRRISIIIPAAGLGSRMKSYGPKSLIKIKDSTTIIENQLRHIFKYFYKPQVILVTGFKSDKVRSSLSHRRIDIVENSGWDVNNVGYSIMLGMTKVKHKSVIIMNGDLVFNSWALKAPFGMYSMLLVDKLGYMKDEEVGCLINDSKVINMMYDLPQKWAQISYFTGKELEILKYNLVACSDDYPFSFTFEIINDIIADGGEFFAYSPPRMKITDIDSSKDLNLVSEIL
jgi:NDP-sugar pyrophosphorylase family protein